MQSRSAIPSVLALYSDESSDKYCEWLAGRVVHARGEVVGVFPRGMLIMKGVLRHPTHRWPPQARGLSEIRCLYYGRCPKTEMSLPL